MSRSGYIDGWCDEWSTIRYRGAVTSSIRGKRGQEFLKELLVALDEMPEKKLISGELEIQGQVCAIGALGKKRQIDIAKLDPEDAETVAATFNIASALAREIVYENDEANWINETEEERFIRMRAWVVSLIK